MYIFVPRGKKRRWTLFSISVVISSSVGESSGGLLLRDDPDARLDEVDCESSSRLELVTEMVLRFIGPLACSAKARAAA